MSFYDLCLMFVEVVRKTDMGDYHKSRQFIVNLKELVDDNPEFSEEIKEKLFSNIYTSFKQWNERMNDAKKLVISDLGNKSDKWYFITIGYDDKNITDEKIIKYSTKVAELKYWTEVNYVNEKFRKNDIGEVYIHHHTHYLVKTQIPKSKIIQYVFQLVKTCVAGQNYIDVKSYKDKCGSYEQKLNYIKGNKIDSKLECVELDREWRFQKNIPSSF